ncbi:MAG: hypothetical protein KDD22_02900, partial [Bdellovibrionales bacterium]|nr:hypothetical protein [Bdellovibrionales bacterium]
MKMQFGVCPRCKSKVSEERLKEAPVICNHCGYSGSQGDQKLEKKIYNTFLKFSLILCMGLVGGFIQAVNWDHYSAEIIPLKFKEMSGTADLADYQRLTEICTKRKKWDCVENALAKRFALSPQTELESLASLGDLQYKRLRIKEAAETLNKYFAQGGLSLDAGYTYARTLSEIGDVDQASTDYSNILKSKPETLQITVAQNYIRLLMKAQRHREAKEVLDEIRDSGANANLFMEKEYKE